jgi:integrase
MDGVGRRTTVDGRSAQEARAKATKVRKRLAAGQPAQDQKATLAATAEAWISSSLAVSDRKPATKSMYATVARKHVCGAAVGSIPLDRLRPTPVEAWIVELRGRGLADSSIRSAYAVLRAILDTAVRDGAISRNPASLVARPKVAHREAMFLSPAEVRQLLAAMAETRFGPLVELLVRTGLRRGEALALRWSDVDLTAGLVRVRGTLARVDGELQVSPPKTAKSRRTVPLSMVAVEVLKGQKTRQAAERSRAGSVWMDTGYVFTTETGRAQDPRNALRAVQTAAKRLGLEGVGLHTLRPSAASVMLVAGVPLTTVSEVLGHASISVTGDIYSHVSPDVSREALDSLSRALGA